MCGLAEASRTWRARASAPPTCSTRRTESGSDESSVELELGEPRVGAVLLVASTAEEVALADLGAVSNELAIEREGEAEVQKQVEHQQRVAYDVEHCERRLDLVTDEDVLEVR
eukprot:4940979-Prymnesium_polylepis.1